MPHFYMLNRSDFSTFCMTRGGIAFLLRPPLSHTAGQRSPDQLVYHNQKILHTIFIPLKTTIILSNMPHLFPPSSRCRAFYTPAICSPASRTTQNMAARTPRIHLQTMQTQCAFAPSDCPSFCLLLVVYLFKIKFSVPLFNFNHSVFECNAENIYIHKSVNDMGKQFISECFQRTCPFVMVTQTT